jgi:hypothetical protein
MKRTVLMILVCFIISPFISRAQNEGIKPVANPSPDQKTAMYSKNTREMADMQEHSTTGGAPCPTSLSAENSACYLEPGWATGKVLLKDNSILENIMLRYDIYDQQFQFIRENDTLAFANPEEVKSFILDGRTFIYREYQFEGVNGKCYFEVLSDGNCQLLVRRTVKYHVSPETKPNLKEDIYIRECTYYISKNGKTAKPIKACRKGVLCAFSDKEDQVKQFMNDNNMKMTTCDQLKEVVEYYNSLP